MNRTKAECLVIIVFTSFWRDKFVPRLVIEEIDGGINEEIRQYAVRSRVILGWHDNSSLRMFATRNAILLPPNLKKHELSSLLFFIPQHRRHHIDCFYLHLFLSLVNFSNRRGPLSVSSLYSPLLFA